MAQQLVASGAPEPILVIIDTSLPNLPGSARRSASRMALDTFRNLSAWFATSACRTNPGALFRRMLARADSLRRSVRTRAHSATNSSAGFDPLVHFGWDEVQAWYTPNIHAQYRAYHGYRPQPYAGKIIVLRAAARGLFEPRDPWMGWDQIAPANVVVHAIPGTHETCLLEPNSRTAAEVLGQCLDRAESLAVAR
jgi:thioesterase domain-containing protein